MLYDFIGDMYFYSICIAYFFSLEINDMGWIIMNNTLAY